MNELQRLRRENRILRNMTRLLAVVVGELFDVLPDDMRALENAQRAIAISRKITHHLAEPDPHAEGPSDGH